MNQCPKKKTCSPSSKPLNGQGSGNSVHPDHTGRPPTDDSGYSKSFCLVDRAGSLGLDKTEGSEFTKINMGQTGDETIEVKEVTMMDKKGIDLIIPVLINGVKINAIADTGSQVSIISNDFAKKLNPPIALGNSVSLAGAGCGSNIVARSGSVATIRIGKTETKWRLLVGNI